jgi:cytochrome P450
METTVQGGLVPNAVLYAVAPFAAIAILLACTRLYTTWTYYRTLKQFVDSPPGKKTLVTPPQIPFTLPWLGNTFSFLAPYPGQYWNELFCWHPRNTGVCTLLIGGRPTHILFSPSAVQALFKAKSASRDVFEVDLYEHVFKFSPDQVHNAMAGKHFEHEMNTQYLIKAERVNELTAQFTRVLEEVLDGDAEEIVKLEEVGLFEWIRDRMFTASTTALMGEKLLQMYPDLCQDFFQFDRDFLSFFFKLPPFMMRDAISNREKIFRKLEEWSKEMHELSGGSPVDPEGPAWEPFFGSRLNRARQLDYKNRKLNAHSSAALDLGITFGLSSNVIPATSWMLMHVLNPDAEPSLLPRLMDELRQAEKPDGSLDIATLIQQPLLQSLWTETLRLYTDVLVTRNLSEDITLPLDEDGKRQVTFRKGDNCFAPSWLGHHDAAAWDGKVPYDQFYAERFLAKDPETGKDVFTMSGTTGKFFPFGGGKTIVGTPIPSSPGLVS